MNKFIVEFTGVAGAGKSLIYEELSKLLSEKGIGFVDSKKINVTKIRYSDIYELSVSLYLTFKMKSKTITAFVKCLKKITSTVLFNKKTKKENELILVDEGVFHKLRDIDRKSREKNLIKKANDIFNYINSPDLVIVIKADPETILQRRTKRKRSNDTFDINDINNLVTTLDYTVNSIKNVQRNIEIIEIDNTDDTLEENINLLYETIRRKVS